jgi:LPS export ABC transporter protein LptC
MNNFFIKNNIKNIAAIIIVAMFFSCGNDFNEVNDFLADKNLPIGVSKNVYLTYTDSGKIKNRLITPLLHDFSNRTKHPYQEFPRGITIITFDKTDSTTITADYAITYKKTQISEIKGNVIVLNHLKKMKLKTEQLFWDQKENYFYSNKKSILTSPNDTLIGLGGFDSNADLTNANMLGNSAYLYINENP